MPIAGKLFSEGFAVELRQAARHGEGADIDEGLDLVSLQSFGEVIERAGGVSDGVEAANENLDAGGLARDAGEGAGDGGVLLGENGAEIEQHAAFFYTGDDGGIGGAKLSGEFVGT